MKKMILKIKRTKIEQFSRVARVRSTLANTLFGETKDCLIKQNNQT